MKSKKKKPAKAITLLTRIESLLADALNEFSAMEKSVEKNARELLVSAEESISKAKDFLTPSTTGGARHVAARVRPRVARAKAKRPVRGRRLTAVHA